MFKPWIDRVFDLRNLTMSWTAMLSRRMGNRAILLLGLCATVYAGVLYVTQRIAPDAPKASHDVILKSRWASPAPSPDVVIVDIDERSLAALAAEHGRWPWPRHVLADGLQKLDTLGVRAVLFNVLMSDPDKANPEADAVMEATAAMVPNISFPLIRLNPSNDAASGLTVAQLLQATGDVAGAAGDRTVAAILPMFHPMLGRAGVANQLPDADGTVRRYAVQWSDPTLSMPSIVARTAQLGGADLSARPPLITLNWRNKAGRYTRLSFSDLLSAPVDDSRLAALRGSFVVLGLSAPGLAQTKATAVSAIEDDNEILATALDDVIHDTHLRMLPDWGALLANLAIIWVLVWMGTRGAFASWLTKKTFVAVQSGLGSVTMLTASYTTHLIDLSDTMAFGMALFGAIKLIHGLDSGWSRARPGLRRAARTAQCGPASQLLVVGYKDSELPMRQAAQLQTSLETVVGLNNVIRVDDLFGGENFIKPACADYSCQLVLCRPQHQTMVEQVLHAPELATRLLVDCHQLESAWDPEDRGFRREASRVVLRNCASVLEADAVPV